MFGISRLYLMAGVAVLAVSAALWLRWDAVQDDRAKTEKANLENRIEHIEDARDVSQEIDDLDDDAIRNELCRRLSGADCPQ